jgi:hypothetical protein
MSKVKAIGFQQSQLREERKAAAAAAKKELIHKVKEAATKEREEMEGKFFHQELGFLYRWFVITYCYDDLFIHRVGIFHGFISKKVG